MSIIKRVFPVLLILIVGFLAFGFASKAEAAITQVQQISAGNSTDATVVATWPASTTAGNLLVAVVSFRGGSGVTITPPTASPAWTLAVRSDNSTTISTAIYYIANASAQSGASTWTLSSSQNATLSLIEYSGVAISSPLDKTATNSGSGTTGNSGTTATTTQANEVAIAGISIDASNKTLTSWTNSFTETNQAVSSGGGQATRSKMGVAHKILSATGTQNTSVTISAIQNWSGAIATFKEVTAPTVTISANPTAITLGQSSTLTWSSTNATSCTASGDWSGSKTTSNSESVTPGSTGTKTYTLTCSGPGGSGLNSATVTVTNPAPTTTSVSPTSKTQGDAEFTLTVNGANFLSSSVVNFNGSARDTTFVSANQLTATILASDLTAVGTFSITVTNPTPGGGTSNVQYFSVNYPPATKFVIIDPTDGTVDNPITVTVQAQRADNSIDTAYQTNVTLNTTGSATVGGVVDIINGVGTKNISNTVAESVTLSLTDSQSTGLDVTSTQAVVFAGGATSQFSLSNSTTLTAGQRAQYTVTRKDQFGNLTTSGSNTIYLYSSSLEVNKKFYNAVTEGSTITSITIADGQSSADFWYYDETPGTYTITASDNSSTPDGNININDAIDSLAVVAGPVSGFMFSDPGNMTAGTRLGYTVIRYDQFGNIVISGDSTVYLSSSSLSPTASFYTSAINGTNITSIDITTGNASANFWYYDETPGTYTITGSDNPTPDGSTGIIDATDSVTVDVAPIVATRFVILDPGNGTVDTPVTVTIQAQDAGGNLDVTYQNNVTLNTTGSATGGGVVDIVDGVGTKIISDTATETVTLSLTDSQTTGLDVTSTANIVFSTGEVSQFSLDNPGDSAAGSRTGYTVTRKDQFGNLITTGATTVYLYGLPTATTKKFYDSASGGSVITFVNITDGNSSAQFWYYDEQAGTASVVVSDNASAPDSTAGIDDVSDQILVSAGAVAKFILNNPGDMTVNTRLGYMVSRQDEFGNPVSSGITLVYPYTSSTGANAKFYDSTTGGLVISSIPIDDGNSSANFWYYDELPGTWVITASDSSGSPNGNTGVIDATDSVIVDANPIVAAKFIIVDPGNGSINVPITVTIRAEDLNGNIDTAYQNDVTLIVSGSATGGGLVNIVNGVGTAQINDTVAETISLSLSDTQATSLDANSTAQINFSALPPVFVPGVGGIPTAKVNKVSFSGKVYPQAKLSIVAMKEGSPAIKKDSVSSSSGKFEITFSGLSAGSMAYALVVQDKDGRSAQTKIYDLNLLNSQSELDVNDILISPTIGFARSTVTKGDLLAIVGYATPLSKLEIEVDDKLIDAIVTAGADGSYKYLLNTIDLTLENHTVRARQITSDGVQSEFSPRKIFFTTNLTVPKTDFNNDGKISISDWSIFLSHWFSVDPATRLLDDLNGDGKVDTSDFSIFVRTLRR